ncbi:MAG: MFS transporter [Candidatus Asgardarchaeia archaeon]
MSSDDSDADVERKLAIHFILLMGLVSLLGDITYEGARSVIGPYLAILGASAVIVSSISGLGDFIAYALRLVSGYVADRTEMYWPLTLLGYGLILSIPFLAFADYWPLAVLFIILERLGKAIRSPARDAMLSHATKKVGRGWGFAVHEMMDQIGAIIGPMVFFLVFMFGGGYHEGFIILFIPAILVLVALSLARMRVPSPVKLEEKPSEEISKERKEEKLPRVFWLYTLFILVSISGFSNFQLVSYHFKFRSVVPEDQIPLLYALAMGVDAIAALFVGKMYDKIGLSSLFMAPLFTLFIPLVVFSQDYVLAVFGVLLWGITMAIHETVMRAAIADITPIRRRGSAYGIFNAAYGLSWFVGGFLIGMLYEISIDYLKVFVILMEVVSVFILFLVRKASYES